MAPWLSLSGFPVPDFLEVWRPAPVPQHLMLAIDVGILAVIAAPLIATAKTMDILAQGSVDVEVRGADRKDEVGAMARSVQVFKESMIRAEQLEAQARAEQEREVARGRKRELLTADFDVMIRRVLRTLYLIH